MKIILRDHVEHLGERGDIVSVAAGYARNYLLPKGLAWEATQGNLKQVEHQRRAWAELEAKDIATAQALADHISSLQLTVTHKAGESGTLYGSVTNAEVADLLAAKKIDIDRRRIQVHEPIKSVGEHKLQIRLHSKVVAPLTLRVVAEGVTESQADTPSEAETTTDAREATE